MPESDNVTLSDIGALVVEFYGLDTKHWSLHLPVRLVALIRAYNDPNPPF